MNLMSECRSSGLEENKQYLPNFLDQEGVHPVSHMATPKKDLRQLFEAVVKKKQGQKELDLEHLPLAEYGEMKMTVGERYKGVAFKERIQQMGGGSLPRGEVVSGAEGVRDLHEPSASGGTGGRWPRLLQKRRPSIEIQDLEEGGESSEGDTRRNHEHQQEDSSGGGVGDGISLDKSRRSRIRGNPNETPPQQHGEHDGQAVRVDRSRSPKEVPSGAKALDRIGDRDDCLYAGSDTQSYEGFVDKFHVCEFELNLAFFFRPSPSRLSPGRNTVFVPVERIVQHLASFPLWGIKREHGPVRSPSCPCAMATTREKRAKQPKKDQQNTNREITVVMDIGL